LVQVMAGPTSGRWHLHGSATTWGALDL